MSDSSDASMPPATSASPLDEGAASSSSVQFQKDAATCILRKKQNRETISTTLERASHVSNIEELELRSLQLDHVSALHLDKLLSGCQDDLQRLTLENCALSDKFFSFSTERLAQNSVQLTHFTMKNCSPLSMTSLISMSALFSSTLTSLELSSCKLARQAGIILGQSLPKCRALRFLVLADNNLRDGGLRAIVDALKDMFTIEPAQLTCKDCDKDDDGSEGWTELDELDISRNGITAAGFSAFSHVPVRRLNASENVIESIGPFLLTNASIRSLNLSGNALSDDGARELINTLFREQTSLESLNLQGCVLSSTSLSFLRKMLRQSTSCPLKVLELDQVCDGSGGDLVERRQCLDEIVLLGSQKYPHLKVRLSKAPVLHVLQENRHPGPKADAVKLPSVGITAAEVLPLDAIELREAVATIVSSATSPPLGAQTTPEPSQYGSIRVSQSQPQQQQQFLVTSSPLSSSPSAQPATRGALSSSSLASAHQHVQLQHVDVEYIVSKTIECMNQNFEQRLGLFLMKMESQQHDKNATYVQFLAAKVDACERAIPRLEARLDVLSDRVAAGNAQLVKLQNEFQLQLQQVRQDLLSVQKESHQASQHHQHQQQQQQQFSTLAPTTPLSLVMQSQVEDFVTARARASEQLTLGEVHKLRRETNPQAIVDAVSSHLAQFKQEFDGNQSSVLCKFTESIVKDSVRLDERVHKVESQIGNLESVIQAEQQASLLALEAISEAFAAGGGGGGGNNGTENGSEAALTPVRTTGYGAPTRTGTATGRRR